MRRPVGGRSPRRWGKRALKKKTGIMIRENWQRDKKRELAEGLGTSLGRSQVEKGRRRQTRDRRTQGSNLLWLPHKELEDDDSKREREAAKILSL